RLLQDWRLFVAPMRAEGTFRKGYKAEVEAEGYQPPETWEMLTSAFVVPSQAHAWARGDLAWWVESLLPQPQRTARYPLAVWQRNPALLRAEPRVVVGTVHSVKGGEAERVVLLPDLSLRATVDQADTPGRHDDIVRLVYVGMTRARHTLVLCAPSSPRAVEWL
ncbi:MAG: hypothetical protein FJX51_12600, partial [Alphaproteobacteria bacterium]|nr:hypothetical protein [Alphaproteobacteria bacterium]